MLSFLKNPLFKLTGVILILYFALFANKENPESLGNRLSSDNIKENFQEMRDKGQFIAGNLQNAKKEIKRTEKEIKIARKEERESERIASKREVEKGTGKDTLQCGDEATISYKVFEQNHRLGYKSKDIHLTLGSKKHPFLESNIVGMKKGGVRAVQISQGFISKDRKLMSFLRKYKTDLIYKITVVNFDKNPSPENICDK